MRILLDTNVLLWWITDMGRKVSERARNAIADPDNVVLVSAASAWQLSIKSSLDRLSMPSPIEEQLPDLLAKYDLQPFDVTVRHALRAGALPAVHRDPFDRLLVAQSQIEDMPLVTSDKLLARYDVKTIW